MTLLCHWRLKIAELSKSQVLKFAQGFDGELNSIEPLKIEASGRIYFRVQSKENSYVVSFDDRPINGQLVFAQRANELAFLYLIAHSLVQHHPCTPRPQRHSPA